MTENENRLEHSRASATGGETGGSLRASEVYFSQIWEATTNAMALSDPEGIVLDVNQAYLQLYGYTRAQVIGHSFAIIFPEDVREWAVEQYREVFASDVTPAPFESIVQRADGSERIVESSATFLTTDGERTAMLSIIRDITARKQAEMAQRMSEARYRAFAHATTNSLYRLTADGTELLEVYGGSQLQHRQDQDPVPSSVLLKDFIHPDDRAATYDAFKTAIQNQQPFEMEHRVRQADGQWGWVLSRTVPVHNETGSVMEWIGSTTNITTRKEAEESLRRSQERLRLIMESITEYAIMTTDLDGYITNWNTGSELIFGYTATEAIGQATDIIFTPEDRARGAPAREREQARRTGGAADERYHLRKDGTRFYVSGMMMPLQDGGIIGYVKVARDLTERKQMEQALQDAKEYAESIIYTIPDSLLVLDSDLCIRTANDTFYAAFQVPREEVEGQLIHAVGNGQWDIPQMRTLFEEILPHRSVVMGYEVEHTFAGIGRRTLLINARWLDHAQLILLTITDITQRKVAEEAVRHMNASLEAQVEARTQQVRTLATQLTMSEQAERRRISQILHDDLQQRLYSLNFYLTNLHHALHDENREDVLRILAEINETLEDSIQATRSLSVDLSPPVLYHEGLVEAILWLATQMEQQHGLDVAVYAAKDLPLPDEDLRVLLFQSVRELLFNTVKHAGVTTAEVSLVFENDQICMEVRDEGQGFDMNARDVQNSQGLLRIEQRLQLLGGRLEIEAGVGQGTRITLCTPLRGGSR